MFEMKALLTTMKNQTSFSTVYKLMVFSWNIPIIIIIIIIIITTTTQLQTSPPLFLPFTISYLFVH